MSQQILIKNSLSRVENKKLYYLVAFLIFPLLFTIPVENILVLEGVGTLNRLIGFCVLPAMLLLLFFRGRVSSQIYKLSLFMLFFIVYAGFSIFWSESSHQAFISWFSLFQVMVLTIVVAVVGVRFGLAIICIPYLLGAAYGSILVIYQAANLDVIRRITIENFNANWMSFLFVMSGVCLFLIIKNSDALSRFFYSIIWCLVGVAVFLLGSRSGMAAYILMTISIFSRSAFRTSLVTLAIFSVGIFSIVFFIQADIEQLVNRFLGIDDLVRSGDLSGRGTIWQSGIGGIESPVLGHGFGAFRLAFGYAPHNSFLSVFFSLGVVGLAFFLGLWGFLLIYLCRSGLSNISLSFLVLALLIPMTFANWEFHKGLWYSFAVLFAYSTRKFECREDGYMCRIPGD